MTHILAIDQGTTSSRAIVFRSDCSVVAVAQQEYPQHFPQSGWVEHDPEDIWRTVVATCRDAIAGAGLAARDIAAIGIANQRETTLVWDRASGKPVHKAIVWQDRRTAPLCRKLKEAGAEAQVAAQTGLLLDPYFSATKIAWLIDSVPDGRARAERGELLFGTVDSFLLWRLTAGAVHATDATNASRTALYDIHANAWSDDLCALFGVPGAMLPQVRDCAAEYGVTAPALFGAPIPIRGMAGDQQAALIGQACFAPGMMKSTYGTGCFAILNTGAHPVASRHRLLSTIAYRLGGETIYGLEGAIFIAGAAVQWLRDGLRIVPTAAASGPMAEAADAGAGRDRDVVLVPAFTGLGAPHWDTEARGALFGLTRDTGPNELAPPRSKACASRRSTCSTRCGPTGAATTASPVRSCALTAAWWRPTGRCSGSPTFSVHRWIAPPSWKRRRSAPPIWPACNRASTRSRRPSPNGGRSIAALHRAWMAPCGAARSRRGATRWRGP
jgi:glycerol kinase